jgi:hypothetical protein
LAGAEKSRLGEALKDRGADCLSLAVGVTSNFDPKPDILEPAADRTHTEINPRRILTPQRLPLHHTRQIMIDFTAGAFTELSAALSRCQRVIRA